VLLQTHHPDAPVLQALVVGDRDSFLAEEMRARREAGMPPFGRLVAIIVSAPDADLADQIAISLGRSAPRFSDVLVLGPAPAPLALLRGRHRRRLLLKTGREVNVQKVVRDWLAGIKIPSSVRVAVDIDPYGFL
ncbi:MAG: primosomal protein N', partial [Rhodospirillaceae bacterium]|nr:primosomal protein N' [Rhodospirillaceae bacterium]